MVSEQAPRCFDSSALVKLIVAEPETEALTRYWNESEVRVASRLADVEIHRFIVRTGARPEAYRRAEVMLGLVDIVSLGEDVLRLARALPPAGLRTLDAIHLASAITLGPETVLVTYDRRLADAGSSAGVQVHSPT